MFRWFTCGQCRCCAHKEKSRAEYSRVNKAYRASTIETGEEAKMEPTSEQPQTEQPSPLRVPAPEGSTGQVPADQMPGQGQDRLTDNQAEGLALAAGLSEGSSVDESPLVDLSDSSESNVKPNSGDIGTTAEKPGIPVRSSTSGVVETLSNGVEKKVDTLSNLAQAIDDFDPVSVFNGSKVSSSNEDLVKTEGSSLFEKDINDETLIDDLVKDIGADNSPLGKPPIVNVGESVQDTLEGHSLSGESKVKNGDSHSNLGDAVSDIKVAKEVTSLEVIADNKDPQNEVSISTAEVTGNDLEGAANGTMSVSTESEGFSEEQNQEEPPVAEDDKTATEDTSETKDSENTTEKKVNGAKTESSPTKAVKSKRKEDKSIEHILKALSSLQTTEEKLAALCKKYADLHEEHRVLQASFKQSQRKLVVVSREKDQLQTEHTKAVMAKSKLESLCRELQKHNQTIRQESIQRAKEEDEKRKEISQKFQTTISEIQQQMQENHDRNKQLREENYELANKLKKFIEQYEAREKQVEKVIQHRELEQKLADAKLEQASAILMEEKGKNQKEKEVLLLQSTEFMKKLQIKDAELQMYKERYEEFQSTISKSEEMFQKFKTEMEKMTIRTKKLEKDGAQWKVKWENANRALIEMADEKTKYDKEKTVLMSKINKLESLCRAMQAERQARKMLETEGVDVSNFEKMSSLIPPEVRQNPMGSESLPVVGNTEGTGDTPPPPGESPDTEPGPSEPSPSCTELENTNNSEDSEDSGDTELTDATVIPKDQTKDTSQANNQDSGQSEDKENGTNQLESPVPVDSCENQSEQNHQSQEDHSIKQDGDQSAIDEVVPDNQSAS